VYPDPQYTVSPTIDAPAMTEAPDAYPHKCGMDRTHHPEQHKCGGDGAKRKGSTQWLPPQPCPYQREVFHDSSGPVAVLRTAIGRKLPQSGRRRRRCVESAVIISLLPRYLEKRADHLTQRNSLQRRQGVLVVRLPGQSLLANPAAKLDRRAVLSRTATGNDRPFFGVELKLARARMHAQAFGASVAEC